MNNHNHWNNIGGDATMTSLAEAQTAESYASYQAGTKRKTLTTSDENDDIIIQNMYRTKRQKIPRGNAFQRGRTGYDQLGILRTKPGITLDLHRELRLSGTYLIGQILGRLDSEPSLCMSCR